MFNTFPFLFKPNLYLYGPYKNVPGHSRSYKAYECLTKPATHESEQYEGENLHTTRIIFIEPCLIQGPLF
jgi:hypothetical protein